MKQVNLMHIALVAPLLYFYGKKMDSADNQLLGMIKVIFFMIPFVVRFPNLGSNMIRSDYINAAHWFVLLPIGLFVLNKEKLDSSFYSIIKYIGICVGAIHLYLLYNKYTRDDKHTHDD